MKAIFKKVVAYILKAEAKLVLIKYKPKIIAITGSLGKTSTKDAVFEVLADFVYVRKSEKSYNTQIGLPLTILGVSNGWNSVSAWIGNILQGAWLILWPHQYPQWLVLEVGVRKPGDMKETAAWLKTDIVIITGIGETPPHIEFFNSRKHLIEEKSILIKTLKKDGLLILNGDDENVLEMKSKTRCKTLVYGFKEGADFLGSSDQIVYKESTENGQAWPLGITFKVDEQGKSLPVLIKGVFGRNHIYAALAALTVASGLKFNLLKAIDALDGYHGGAGRMKSLEGINHTLLIDDTYNSSPFACESALRTLGTLKTTGRKIAVLGDMLELGKHTEEAHMHIGALMQDNCDIACVVGPRSEFIKRGAMEAGMEASKISQFKTSYEVAEFLKKFVQENDVILIKGSQGMRMERIVSVLVKDQRNKSKFLVRQTPEWLKRK